MVGENISYDSVAVIIPCYNEEVTVAKVVSDFKQVLPGATIYVFDNLSSDDTANKAKEAGAVVVTSPVKGKGNVVRQAFMDIDTDVYVMVDGDDTYSAESAPAMVASVVNGHADMVIGDRLSSTYFTENKRLFHNSGNKFVRFFINHTFGVKYNDIMTGYRAFSRKFVKSYPVLSRGFEIETEMSIHAADKNLYVTNVICDYRDRPEGSVSKLNTISDGVKVIFTILRLIRTYKPIRYFGTIAAILFTLSIVFFIPVLIDYDKTGIVDQFPTLIVCGFTAIGGIQSLFTGFILNALVTKDKRDFETTCLQITSSK